MGDLNVHTNSENDIIKTKKFDSIDIPNKIKTTISRTETRRTSYLPTKGVRN